jgi:hypothetical protein
MQPQRPTSPEEILDEHSGPIRELAGSLRELIRTTVPEAEERAYPGWHGIGYHHPEVGYFAAIFPERDLVKLAFEHGVELPDPQGLLQGEGKRVRYVILSEAKAVPRAAIRALLQAAIHRLG